MARIVEVRRARATARRWLACEHPRQLLFTENETNNRRLFGSPNASPYVKDGINDYVVHGAHDAVNPEQVGTKAAGALSLGDSRGRIALRLRLRLSDVRPTMGVRQRFRPVSSPHVVGRPTSSIATVIPSTLSPDATNVMRQRSPACSGRSSSITTSSRTGSTVIPASRRHRRSARTGRNHEWTHLYNADVISMPDKWEYPWYAAWDLAFHCIPLALVDSDFAKDQLISDAARMVHAPERPDSCVRVGVWRRQSAGARVGRVAGLQDREEAPRQRRPSTFLERVFHKLLLNFTWWVNRKDADGMNIFQGGFLGLDNIGVFDRSAPLPTGGHLEQSDGTSWMAMYTLNLLAIAHGARPRTTRPTRTSPASSGSTSSTSRTR